MTHANCKIHSVALRYIYSHSMDIDTWRWTHLETLPSLLSDHVRLTPEESPVVSYYMTSTNWYVMTSSRVIGQNEQQRFDFDPRKVTAWRWGDFKGVSKEQTAIASVELVDREIINVRYETGKASMAPIYYALFWKIKYPVIDKLVG